MKLYDLKAGMNPRRVRIFLAEKGIEIPITPIDMMKGENQTPEFLKLNPLGTLPVLELDDGTILTELVAICRYFEFSKPEPNLFGHEGLEQARVEMWNRRLELELMRPWRSNFGISPRSGKDDSRKFRNTAKPSVPGWAKSWSGSTANSRRVPTWQASDTRSRTLLPSARLSSERTLGRPSRTDCTTSSAGGISYRHDQQPAPDGTTPSSYRGYCPCISKKVAYQACPNYFGFTLQVGNRLTGLANGWMLAS